MRKHAGAWQKLAAIDAGELPAPKGEATPKPPKWTRRVKRLRDEVRTLFGAVSDLTMRVYDVEQQVYDMRKEARDAQS